MAIKRKTHLNLSGSHHTLDSDNAFVGGTLYITGTLSASAGITGSIHYVDAVGSVPFLVNGTNITTNYNSLGQWEITGSGGGGTNFFTEVDASTIFTTSSVRLAQLSASLGAIITGSVLAEGTFSQGNADNNTVSNFSFANGNALSATGNYSHAEGIGGNATNDGAHVEGYSSTASGYASHAEGHLTTASGSYSHAEGRSTQAQNDYAHAEGSGSIASGIASHGEGKDTQAQGDYSHAEGSSTVASGYASHAEGAGTTASSFYAHAEGANTTASGLYAHSEGQLAVASGQAAHAQGLSTQAQGDYSHAEGSGSIAVGIASHAEGWNTTANGTGSFAAGLSTVANGPTDGTAPTTTQAVFGKYNQTSNTNSLFVVGDGLNTGNRHDVLRVNSGSVEVTGSLIAPQITGSLSGTVAGNPFVVAGANITTNYNSLGQWEITGSGGGSVTGSNTQVQFNDDGAFGASSLLTFNTASVGNVGIGTLTYLTGAVGYLSGSNIDNQAYTLVMSGVADVVLATPGFFDPALVVKTPVLMTQSLMLFDGIHDPFNLGVDTSLPGGGIALANGSRFTLHSGSWTPVPSDSGGKDPVVTVEVDTNGSGSVQVVGSLLVQSASLDQYNVFSVFPSTTANQLRMTHVGEANFFSGAVNLSHNASILFRSGSSNTHGFELKPSNKSGGATLIVNTGSIQFNSSSQDAQVGNTSFLIQASTDAHKADVIFDQGFDNVNFVGINVRPLYVTMSTTTATGTELSGSLLTNLLKEGSVGKLDFNVVAAASATDDYASWTFSTTVRRNQAGTTLVLAATELDSITEGTNASAWDVNVNSDGTIQCTGSAGTVNWYAQVTKKMILSGSGMIVY